MAAVTSGVVAGVSALAGGAMSVADAIKAQKARDSARQTASKVVAQMKSVKEQDVFGQVQVPTLGYELAQQSADRATKGAMEAARGAGAEGVIGATGAILQASNEAGLNLAAQADQTQFQRDLYQAQNKAGIEERRAIRESEMYGAELAGAQQAAADAQARIDLGITNAINTGIGLAGDMYSLTPLYKRTNTTTTTNPLPETT